MNEHAALIDRLSRRAAELEQDPDLPPTPTAALLRVAAARIATLADVDDLHAMTADECPTPATTGELIAHMERRADVLERSNPNQVIAEVELLRRGATRLAALVQAVQDADRYTADAENRLAELDTPAARVWEVCALIANGTPSADALAAVYERRTTPHPPDADHVTCFATDAAALHRGPR